MENGKQQAFPFTIEDTGNPSVTSLGLTKREYFAAMAMQGILSNHMLIDSSEWDWVAKNAVKQADELLKQLSDE